LVFFFPSPLNFTFNWEDQQGDEEYHDEGEDKNDDDGDDADDVDDVDDDVVVVTFNEQLSKLCVAR
jgi:hypothetical protein